MVTAMAPMEEMAPMGETVEPKKEDTFLLHRQASLGTEREIRPGMKAKTHNHHYT